jgi:hypothetical protein
MTMHAITGVVIDIREVQAPVLAVMLLGACVAKLSRVLRAGSLDAGLGPTELFPLAARRAAAMIVCACELALGAALLVTVPPAARDGTGALDGAAADGARIAATAFFLVAMCALIELRGRRPDVGCGCFGDLSTRPVGARSIARSALLALAALASIGGPGLRLPPGAGGAPLLVIFCAEFLLIALLSPEAGEALVRLGHSEPCELRSVPAPRSLAALHRSSHWQRQASVVTSDVPTDLWRELCWRYVVYPGRLDGADADVVFAVQIKQRRPAIRSAVVLKEMPPTSPVETASAETAAPVSSPAETASQETGSSETTGTAGTAGTGATETASADLPPEVAALNAIRQSNAV